MSRISVELEHLCTDLRSEKPVTRFKAVERVLQLLNHNDDVLLNSQSLIDYKLLLISLLQSMNMVSIVQDVYDESLKSNPHVDACKTFLAMIKNFVSLLTFEPLLLEGWEKRIYVDQLISDKAAFEFSISVPRFHRYSRYKKSRLSASHRNNPSSILYKAYLNNKAFEFCLKKLLRLKQKMNQLQFVCSKTSF